MDRIAVLRGGALGDLLLALPAIRALSEAYPAAEISLLGSPQAAMLLNERPGAPDRVLPLPRVPGVGAPEGADPDRPGARRFVESARRERYDLAVQAHGGGRYSNPFLLDLGARVSIGARTPDAAELDRSIAYVYFQHEVLRWLEVVGLAGAAPIELEPTIQVSDAELQTARRLLGPRAGRSRCGPLVVVHPGATDPRRRWPVERFGEACARLLRDGARVAVVGSEAESELCARVAEEIGRRSRGAGSAVDLGGRLDLGGLVGVLALADLLVGNDSGPRHLAQAVGTPTASVFWCGNLVNAGPLSRDRHRVQVAWTSSCPVCGRDCTQVGWTAPRCAHDVSFVAEVQADAVASDARSLLA